MRLFNPLGQALVAFPLLGPVAVIGGDQAPFRVHRLKEFVTFSYASLDMFEHRQRDHLVALGQPDPAYPYRRAPAEHANLGDREADALAAARRQQHVLVGGAGLHADEPAALAQFHRDLAVCLDVDEVRQRVASHIAVGGGEHHVQVAPAVLVLGQRHHGRDRFARLQRQQVYKRLAACLRRRERQPVDFELVHLAGGGEEQHRGVRVDDVDLSDEVLLARAHAGAAFAAAALGAVSRDRDALYVAAVADGDDHVLALDKVLDVLLELDLLNPGAAVVGEPLLHIEELRAQDVEKARARPQDVQAIGDLPADLAQLLGNLVALEPRQPVQAQIQNGARLGLGQLVAPVRQPAARLVGHLDQRRHRPIGRPRPRHQALARRRRVGGTTDNADHRVQVGHGERQSDQQVGALARLAELERRAPVDHLLAE